MYCREILRALKRLGILVLAITSVAAAAATPENDTSQPLEVVLSHPSSSTKAESGIIVVTLINHGATPILMPIQRTPISGMVKGRLMGDILKVEDNAGKQARYIGSFFRLMPDKTTRDQLYTRIDPGQTIDGEINLSLDYDLKAGGGYKVSYEQDYGGIELLAEGNIPSKVSKSNVLDIWVNTSLIGSMSLVAPLDNGERECTTLEKTTLDLAKISASSRLSAAFSKATSLYRNVWNMSANLQTVTLVPDDLYTIWQGEPVNNIAPSPPSLSLRDPEVWNNVDFIPLHLASLNAERVSKLSFKCGCPSNFAATVGAVARTSNPYEVNVCDIFFSVSMNDQIMTLVHETSHFKDEEDPVFTQDFAIGMEEARNLARTNHAKAVLSADNFAYWIMLLSQPQ